MNRQQKKPSRIKRPLRNLSEDELGLSTVEYIIILVLIAVLAIGVWREFGESVQLQVAVSTDKVDALDKK